jgi:hypothetical protein
MITLASLGSPLDCFVGLTTTTKRSSGSLWTEAARRPACLCGRQILAAQDDVLRMSAFSVGQAFDARWSSYLCHSRRARPADDGLHLLLRNVSYNYTSKPSIIFFFRYWCWAIVVVGAESFVSNLSCAQSGAGITPCLYRRSAALEQSIRSTDRPISRAMCRDMHANTDQR